MGSVEGGGGGGGGGGGNYLKTAVAGLDVGPCHPMLCNLHLGFQVCVCSGCFRVTLPFNRQ